MGLAAGRIVVRHVHALAIHIGPPVPVLQQRLAHVAVVPAQLDADQVSLFDDPPGAGASIGPPAVPPRTAHVDADGTGPRIEEAPVAAEVELLPRVIAAPTARARVALDARDPLARQMCQPLPSHLGELLLPFLTLAGLLRCRGGLPRASGLPLQLKCLAIDVHDQQIALQGRGPGIRRPLR